MPPRKRPLKAVKPVGEFEPRGQRLWDWAHEVFDGAPPDDELLRECCHALDGLAALEEVVRAEGPMLGGRVHPAVVELRGGRLLVARLLRQLNLEQPGEESTKTIQARRAATARWANHVPRKDA